MYMHFALIEGEHCTCTFIKKTHERKLVTVCIELQHFSIACLYTLIYSIHTVLLTFIFPLIHTGSNHYGIAGYYALKAVNEGLIVSCNGTHFT